MHEKCVHRSSTMPQTDEQLLQHKFYHKMRSKLL